MTWKEIKEKIESLAINDCADICIIDIDLTDDLSEILEFRRNNTSKGIEVYNS